MNATKKDIFTKLQREILPLQGYRQNLSGSMVDIGLGPIRASFPNHTFPIGAMHEFLSAGAENAAATGGFIAGLVAALMKSGGVSAWISASRTIFPPALKYFGIEPDRIIFVDVKKQSDVPWALEEALKCVALVAVVGEMQEMSFTTSRRLQLAVEQSRVTGFILRNNPRNCNTTACVSRWRISQLPTEPEESMPGIGFPHWKVELLKARNGKPGTWNTEWVAGRFRFLTQTISSISHELKRKTG